MEKCFVYFWIGLGSALGGMGRFWFSGWVARRLGETFPWGTIAVNVTGSLVIGLLAALSAPDGRLLINPRASQFLMVGVCGGYTTFSSFSLQTLNLACEGQWLYAVGNAVLSLALCVLAVWIGHSLGQAISR